MNGNEHKNVANPGQVRQISILREARLDKSNRISGFASGQEKMKYTLRSLSDNFISLHDDKGT